MTTADRLTDGQLGFHFDQRFCIACRACQVACQDLHDLPEGASYLVVESREEGVYPRPTIVHILHGCWHCEQPPCVAACGSGALHKRPETGIVLIDAETCIHCDLCGPACPYGAIVATPAGNGKCDLCVGALAAGRAPACVEACPMHVLGVGPLRSLPGVVPAGHGLPDPTDILPAIRMIAHRDWHSDASPTKETLP